MDLTDCFYLGKIIRSFGYKGELIIHLDVDDPSAYEKMESVFVYLHGALIPFFIDRINRKPNSRQMVVHFQDINMEEDARHLYGKDLYLPLSLLPPLEGNKFYYHEIEGFKVVDMRHGDLGHVLQVLDLPGNPLLEIKGGSKEILIPLRDEFIERIDRAGNRIYVKTPEGLVDMYLSGSTSSDL